MLSTTRLIFNIPVEDDFDRYYEIHSDPQTNLFNPSGPMSLDIAKTSFAEILNHWRNYHFGVWVIKEKSTNQITGFGGLSYRLYGDELKLNLGYRFDKDHWGKGYATELSLYAIEHGFSTLGFEKIFAVVRPHHAVSIKVLEKCGMKLNSTLDDVPGSPQSLVYIIENKLPALLNTGNQGH